MLCDWVTGIVNSNPALALGTMLCYSRVNTDLRACNKAEKEF